MKINSFQPSLLIVVLITLIPNSTFAISFNINTCIDSTSANSLLYDPSLFSMKDTLDPNKLSFKDWKSQAKAIRYVNHEKYIASREERKKKDNFGALLKIAAIIIFGLLVILCYKAFESVD